MIRELKSGIVLELDEICLCGACSNSMNIVGMRAYWWADEEKPTFYCSEYCALLGKPAS